MTYPRLKRMIVNELDKRGMTRVDLAKLLKGSETSIGKFLKESEREMQDFDLLIKIVRYLFPDKETELLREYCQSLKPTSQTLRYMLEYALVNRNYDFVYYLSDLLLPSNRRESVEWATIYKIFTDCLLGKESLLDTIDKASKAKAKTIEMKVMTKIIQFHCYYELKVMNIVMDWIAGVEHDIELINDRYIRNSFLGRFSVIMCNIYLHNNQVEKSREYALKTVQEGVEKTIQALGYFRLGDSYLYESEEKALRYLFKAKEIYEEINYRQNMINEVVKSINFVNLYWVNNIKGELIETGDHVSDKHMLLFQLIRSNKFEEAEKLIHTIDTHTMNDYQKGFFYYYKGLLSKDSNNFYRSMKHFKLKGHNFYAQLSLIELQRNGENKELLEFLSVY